MAASCLLHLGIAVALVELAGEEAMIAGGEQAQVALLGNAPEDQLASGQGEDERDANTTSVTLVTMLDARRVDTAEAAVEPAETIQPLESSGAAAAADSEVSGPVEVEAIKPEPPVAAAPADVVIAPVRQGTSLAMLPQAAEVALQPVDEKAEPLERMRESPLPEVLMASKLEPTSVDRLAPLKSQMTAAPEPPAAAIIEPAPPVDAARPLEPGRKTAPLDERPRPTPAEAVATLAPVAEPLPQVRKAGLGPGPANERKPKPPKAERPDRSSKPVRPQKSSARQPSAPKKAATVGSGSKGSNQTDARRGDENGAASGRSSARSTGSRQSMATGNAAVSNYPGKIVSKLRRALRYPAEARSSRLRGEVHVSFTISASGAVSGVRVVRGSGSPVLDRAALEAVRRAAPFPAIPDGAGRLSWSFTVPLAFSR